MADSELKSREQRRKEMATALKTHVPTLNDDQIKGVIYAIEAGDIHHVTADWGEG